MGNQIVMIGNQKKFMISSIVKGLVERDFDVVRASANIESLSSLDANLHIYLIYLEPDFNSSLYIFLSDLCMTRDLRIVFIGEQQDLETASQTIPSQHIAGLIQRPINLDSLSELLEDLCNTDDAVSKRKRILVVDDNGTMLHTIKSWLSSKYSVYIVNSGTQAITFLAKQKVDLILLDYEMPVISGPQVMEMLRSEPEMSSIPVIFLTAKGDKESVLTAAALKPEQYLLKSLPASEIVSSIDQFFAKRP